MTGREAYVTIIVALITAGALSFLRDTVRGIRRRWAESTADALERKNDEHEMDSADKSSIRLIRENTALAARNEQLYAELTKNDERHSAERQAWRDREVALRAESEAREAALRAELDDMERRLRDMLDELVELRTRHGVG